MATSTIPKTHVIQYKTVSVGDVTINANGYLNISGYKPSGMTNFLFCQIGNFGGVSPTGAFTVTADGVYLIASANTTITRLVLRYYYTN